MYPWSIASPRNRRLSGAGLALLVGLAVSPAWAEDAAGAKPQTAPATPAKATPAAKPAAAKPAPAPKPVGPAECLRTGQRVIAALARDDSGAASQFFTFYTAFKCPPQHLAQSFGCLVGLQTKNPSISNPSPEQVAQCWADPSTIPEVKPPQPETPPAGEAK